MDLRTFVSFGEIILFVAGDRQYLETLDHRSATFPIQVNHIVYASLIIFAKYIYMNDIFPHKNFVTYSGHYAFAILPKNDDIINI